MQFHLDPYYLILFTISFVIFTIIGTVSHEYGHIAVAKYLGYDTTLHYGSMNWSNKESNDKLNEIFNQYEYEIKNNLPFDRKDEYENLRIRRKTHSLWITLGGPIQTMLTGTFGFFLILFRRNYRIKYGIKLIDWLSIFLTLFWLREIFNLAASTLGGILNRNGVYFGGDEARISKKLNLPEGFLPIILGSIGLLISIYVIFYTIPMDKRLTFIISGLIGGCVGFILWMKIVGPIILP